MSPVTLALVLLALGLRLTLVLRGSKAHVVGELNAFFSAVCHVVLLNVLSLHHFNSFVP